ncbi:MAG: PKD domain-containing protein, partial [Bacteroidia bacterium]
IVTVNGSVAGSTSWTGSLSRREKDTVTIPGILINNNDLVRVYTSNPNGTTELPTGAGNDTLSRIALNGLSGTYTIGGTSPDYPDFTSAASDLNTIGVCGNIVFEVRDGTYTEQVRLNNIPGASANSTVTFRSESGDSSLVKLIYASTTNSENYTLQLNATNWVRFESMTLEASGDPYGHVIELNNGSHWNQFSHCVVRGDTMPNSTSTDMALVWSTIPSNNSNNSFEYNHLDGGSYGIWMSGGDGSTGSIEAGTVIRHNKFQKQYYYGIRLENHDAPILEHNQIDLGASPYTGTRYGIWLSRCENATSVKSNNICIYPGFGFGIYLTNCDGKNAAESLITNNSISMGNPNISSTSYGIYLTNSGFQRVAYNNVNIVSAGSSSRAMYASGGGANHVLNNNFVCQGPGYAVYYASITAVIQSDYNNFFSSGSKLGYFGANQVSLSDWQHASCMDANSINVDPGYYSAKDLHVCNHALDGAATPLSYVSTDFDGEARSGSSPDIGADEFVPSNASITAGFNASVGGTPLDYTFTDNSTGSPSSWRWDFGDGNTSTAQSPAHTFAEDGFYDICLIVQQNCARDTMCTTIQVGCPVHNTEWSSSNNIFTVNFTDETPVSIQSWLWDFDDGNTSNQQNPIHTYLSAGSYTVCLTTVGPCGIDSTCKTVNIDCSYLIADAGIDQIICQGNTAGVTIGGNTAQSGGIGTISYNWTGDPGLSSTTSPNPTATPVVDANYTLTVSDDNCSVTDHVKVIASGGPSGFPDIIEDFESFNTCTGSCNATCILPNGWNNATTGDRGNWIVDINGTSSSSTGPDVDHTLGNSSGKYLYFESSSPCYSNVTANLESPAFDFTNARAPSLEFWYHMYGSSMGQLHIDVQTLTSGGWILDIVPSRTDNRNIWQKWTVDLTAYTGEPSVKIRFRGVSRNSFTSDMAIDDVKITDNPPLDASLCGMEAQFDAACNLTGDVNVCVASLGFIPITSVDIQWSVNGIMQTPYSWTGNLEKGNTQDNINIGNTALAAGDVIKAWTDAPNGQCELTGSQANDTLSTILALKLNGTYTIGGTSPDYPDFTSAVSDLKAIGVCGPVVFDVRDGIYTEQIELTAIEGASPVNTITFRSESGDSSLVQLSYASTLSTSNYTLALHDGASWFRFHQISITATDATYGRVIDVYGESSWNSFTNCLLIGALTNSTSTNTSVIFSNPGTNDNHNVFEDNQIEGGSYGMYWHGVNAQSLEEGTVVRGNIFKGQYFYGLRILYQNTTTIEENDINLSSSSYTGSVWGIYLSYCNGKLSVAKNTVCTHPNYGIGIYLNNCASKPGQDQALVANNMVSIGNPNTTSTSYGIFLTLSSFIRIAHNSVLLESNGSESAAFYATGGGANTIYNNHFVNIGSGYAVYIYSQYSVIASDYNNYFSLGTNVAHFVGTNTPSVGAFKSVSGLDAETESVRPNFVSAKDLHINFAACDTLFGKQLGYIMTDIDGDTRQSWDIGADENPNKSIPVVSCVPTYDIDVDLVPSVTIGPSDLIVSATDPCGIDTSMLDKSTFTVADLGTNLVTVTVVSKSGVSATCTTQVNVTQCTISNTPAPQVLQANACPGGRVDIAALPIDFSLIARRFHFYLTDPSGPNPVKIGSSRVFRGRSRTTDRVMVRIMSDTCFYVVATGQGEQVKPCFKSTKILVTTRNCSFPLRAAVMLEGAYDATQSAMRDNLRNQNLIPLQEPYTALGYTFVGNAPRVMPASALTVTGNDAIVDWVIVELRDQNSPATIIHSMPALLQKDGDIVDASGSSNIVIQGLLEDDYFLAVLHRNHLGAMTATAVHLDTAGVTMDFSDPTVTVYGNSSARKMVNGKALLYAGDADGNGQVQNTDNVMQWMPNVGTAGYKSSDYNMDGQVQNVDFIYLWVPNVGRGTPVPK